MSELTPTFTDVKKPTERSVSKVILAFAHGDGVVLLCEESSALDFVQNSGSAGSIGVPSIGSIRLGAGWLCCCWPRICS